MYALCMCMYVSGIKTVVFTWVYEYICTYVRTSMYVCSCIRSSELVVVALRTAYTVRVCNQKIRWDVQKCLLGQG